VDFTVVDFALAGSTLVDSTMALAAAELSPSGSEAFTRRTLGIITTRTPIITVTRTTNPTQRSLGITALIPAAITLM